MQISTQPATRINYSARKGRGSKKQMGKRKARRTIALPRSHPALASTSPSSRLSRVRPAHRVPKSERFQGTSNHRVTQAPPVETEWRDRTARRSGPARISASWLSRYVHFRPTKHALICSRLSTSPLHKYGSRDKVSCSEVYGRLKISCP